MRASQASRTIVGLPSISLVPCISNESREDRKQVDYIGVVILEGNGFITWIRHAMGDKGWGGLQQEGGKDGGKRQSNTWLLYLGSDSYAVCVQGTAWRGSGAEDHCGDLRSEVAKSSRHQFFFRIFPQCGAFSCIQARSIFSPSQYVIMSSATIRCSVD